MKGLIIISNAQYFIFAASIFIELAAVAATVLNCTEPYEEYQCGSACQTTCATLGQECPIINIKCNDDCYCINGYARNDRNVCIPICQCGGSSSSSSSDSSTSESESESSESSESSDSYSSSSNSSYSDESAKTQSSESTSESSESESESSQSSESSESSESSDSGDSDSSSDCDSSDSDTCSSESLDSYIVLYSLDSS